MEVSVKRELTVNFFFFELYHEASFLVLGEVLNKVKLAPPRSITGERFVQNSEG